MKLWISKHPIFLVIVKKEMHAQPSYTKKVYND